ncbi:hypothetical protein NECID01_0020 [Nematocida sp. AWRm77]|nr:hypothetical protein NECID01_0020 [Nematocida sp. AWRm77]
MKEIWSTLWCFFGIAAASAGFGSEYYTSNKGYFSDDDTPHGKDDAPSARVTMVGIDVFILEEALAGYQATGWDLHTHVMNIFGIVEAAVNKKVQEINRSPMPKYFRFIPQFKNPHHMHISHECRETYVELSEYLAAIYAEDLVESSFILITHCSFEHHRESLFKMGQSAPYITQTISGNPDTMNIIQIEYMPKRLVYTLASAILKAAAVSNIEPVSVVRVHRNDHTLPYILHVSNNTAAELLSKSHFPAINHR